MNKGNFQLTNHGNTCSSRLLQFCDQCLGEATAVASHMLLLSQRAVGTVFVPGQAWSGEATPWYGGAGSHSDVLGSLAEYEKQEMNPRQSSQWLIIGCWGRLTRTWH